MYIFVLYSIIVLYSIMLFIFNAKLCADLMYFKQSNILKHYLEVFTKDFRNVTNDNYSAPVPAVLVTLKN